MASSIPISSPTRKEQHNPHPYPIKTSHTGLLTRSNSSKAHGSWSKHHYTPVPSSPSAFVFDPPESSPALTRRRNARSSLNAQPLHASPSGNSQSFGSPQGSETNGSMSPSPSMHSRSWVGRNSEGEQVNLPRHPYLWNPAQLATYLSSELCGSDGEPLDPDMVKAMVDFIQQRKIGGRAFLNLDQEDFQEMEGIDSLWSNALWDASSTLRQGITPYRPSRSSRSTYKRGRVRGVVDLFERSASESSDISEDEAQNKPPGKVVFTTVPPAREHSRKVLTPKLEISESEDDSSKSAIDPPRHNRLHRNTMPEGDLEVPLPKESYMDAGTSSGHNFFHDIDLPVSSSADAELDLNKYPALPPGSSNTVNDNLAVVIPPQTDTLVNLVLAPDEFQNRTAVSPQSSLLNDNMSPNIREDEIASIHTQEISEPTMAELYEQLYGVPPPSSRSEPPMPQAPSEDEGASETMKIVAAATSSDPPPTALRPIVQRRAASPPPSLRRIFRPSSGLQVASETGSQSVYILPAGGSERDEAAVHTLSALKERLAIVERRLEAMELKDAKEDSSNNVVSRCSTASRRTTLPIEDDLDNLDLKVHSSRSAETLRSWQSAYILFAGATTGVTMVLIPMLFRHLWSR